MQSNSGNIISSVEFLKSTILRFIFSSRTSKKLFPFVVSEAASAAKSNHIERKSLLDQKRIVLIMSHECSYGSIFTHCLRMGPMTSQIATLTTNGTQSKRKCRLGVPNGLGAVL